MSAIYTAKKYLKFYNNSYPEEVTPCLGELGLTHIYSNDDVKSCARCFNELAKLLQTSNLQMLNQKFWHSKYLEVSRIVTAVRNASSNAQKAQRH